jgi:hypothetical protein
LDFQDAEFHCIVRSIEALETLGSACVWLW